ncbi:krab-a domain-containing protein, partial [Lasius niger]
MNPMRFVKKFERVAQYEVRDDAEQLYFLGKCLKDQAAIWFELQDFDTIEDAKDEFIRYFWGEEQQAKFREKIYTGRYKQIKESRMADYALDLARQAKMLEPPMGDREFIRAIKRHFEKETTREIRTTTATSVAELVTLLDEIQDEKDSANKTRAEEKTSTAKTGYFNRRSDQPRYPTRGQRYQPNRYGRNGGGNPNRMKALPWYNNANKPNDGTRKTGFKTKTKSGNEAKTEKKDENTARGKKNTDKDKTNRGKAVGALRKKTSESESDESRRDEKEEEAYRSDGTNSEEIEETRDDSESEEEDTKQLAIVRTCKIIKDLEEIELKQENGIKGRPIVIAKVGENRIITLIDSGADFSVMSKETFERIQKGDSEMRRIPIKKCTMRGAFKEKGQTIPCKVQIEVKIEDKILTQEFYVAEKLIYPMILGCNALEKFRANMAWREGKFSVKFNDGNDESERPNAKKSNEREEDNIAARKNAKSKNKKKKKKPRGETVKAIEREKIKEETSKVDKKKKNKPKFKEKNWLTINRSTSDEESTTSTETSEESDEPKGYHEIKKKIQRGMEKIKKRRRRRRGTKAKNSDSETETNTSNGETKKKKRERKTRVGKWNKARDVESTEESDDDETNTSESRIIGKNNRGRKIKAIGGLTREKSDEDVENDRTSEEENSDRSETNSDNEETEIQRTDDSEISESENAEMESIDRTETGTEENSNDDESSVEDINGAIDTDEQISSSMLDTEKETYDERDETEPTNEMSEIYRSNSENDPEEEETSDVERDDDEDRYTSESSEIERYGRESQIASIEDTSEDEESEATNDDEEAETSDIEENNDDESRDESNNEISNNEESESTNRSTETTATEDTSEDEKSETTDDDEEARTSGIDGSDDDEDRVESNDETSNSEETEPTNRSIETNTSGFEESETETEESERIIPAIKGNPREKEESENDSIQDTSKKKRTTRKRKKTKTIESRSRDREKLEKVLDKYEKVFEDGIGRVKHYKHRIEMIDEKGFKRKTYPVPEVYKERVKNHIADWEKQGIVEKAPTQYISPLVTVVKKSGDLRVCLDARELNKKMRNDHAQPPTIEEIFNKIGNRKLFTTLDVTQAFWQIPLEKESKKYTGFIFNNQSYVFRRMPFGLKTAGASFTRAMNKALNDETMNYVLVYLDDILIASNSMREHLTHIETVLEKLQRVGFKLNRDKCEFARSEIRFLGHTFNEITADINEETRSAIRSFPRPTNKKGIQAFLGLANWDRRFIKNLARKTRPLEMLLKKDAKFDWTKEQQDAFDEIKEAFEDAPVLYLARPDRRFGVEIDASKTGLGARLYQYESNENEKKYTVAYASRSLKKAEMNYTITELECLALEFDLEIRHIPGKENKIADCLSRQYETEATNEKGDEEIKICAMLRHDDATDTTVWIDLIRQAQTRDDELLTLSERRPDKYKTRDGLIRVGEGPNERIAIPKEIAWELTDLIHRFLVHFGTDKTIEFVSRFFKIKNMERIVRDMVASCETCIASKYYTRPTRGEEYYELPNDRDKVVSLDLFGPLPTTKGGKKYIIVLMDQFTKLTKCYPINNQRLETIIETLDAKYFNEIGIPETILTDNGGQFVTDKWKEYAERVGFMVRRTSPYNPQSNPVERVMRELGRVMRAYFHDRQTQWNRIVPRFERTVNNTEHFSTGGVPIELYPEIDEKLEIDPRIYPEEETRIDVEQKREQMKQYLERKASARKRQTDKHGAAKKFQPGDKVWLKVHRRSDASRKLTKKIHRVYEGPYKIREIIRRNAYLIENLDGGAIGVVNARKLRPHREARLKPPLKDEEEINGNVGVIRIVPIEKLTKKEGTSQELTTETGKPVKKKRRNDASTDDETPETKKSATKTENRTAKIIVSKESRRNARKASRERGNESEINITETGKSKGKSPIPTEKTSRLEGGEEKETRETDRKNWNARTETTENETIERKKTEREGTCARNNIKEPNRPESKMEGGTAITRREEIKRKLNIAEKNRSKREAIWNELINEGKEIQVYGATGRIEIVDREREKYAITERKRNSTTVWKMERWPAERKNKTDNDATRRDRNRKTKNIEKYDETIKIERTINESMIKREINDEEKAKSSTDENPAPEEETAVRKREEDARIKSCKSDKKDTIKHTDRIAKWRWSDNEKDNPNENVVTVQTATTMVPETEKREKLNRWNNEDKLKRSNETLMIIDGKPMAINVIEKTRRELTAETTNETSHEPEANARSGEKPAGGDATSGAQSCESVRGEKTCEYARANELKNERALRESGQTKINETNYSGIPTRYATRRERDEARIETLNAIVRELRENAQSRANATDSARDETVPSESEREKNDLESLIDEIRKEVRENQSDGELKTRVPNANRGVDETRENATRQAREEQRTKKEKMDYGKPVRRNLEELATEEKRLREEIKRFLGTREKALQAERRRTIRVEKLRRIVERLREAPEEIQESDGEETMTELVKKVKERSVDTMAFRDKFDIVSKDSGPTITYTMDATLRADAAIADWIDKPIRIMYEIRNGNVQRDVDAEWSERIKFHSVEQQQQQQQIRTEKTAIDKSATRDAKNETETSTSQCNVKAREKNTARDKKNTNGKTKRVSKTTPESRKNPVIRITKIEKVKPTGNRGFKELTQLVKHSNEKIIVSGKRKQESRRGSYKEESSGNESDEDFVEYKRRKQNNRSLKESDEEREINNTSTNVTSEPGECLEDSIPSTSRQEGGMQPVTDCSPG